MGKCPVCGKEGASLLCGHCGFDSSLDYERYPTFGKLNTAPDAVSRRTRNRLQKCPLCASAVENGQCVRCGLAGIPEDRDPGFSQLQKTAHQLRLQLVETLTDFCVVVHHYRFNPATSRLEPFQQEERRLGDGRHCFGQVLWSGPWFGQLSPEEFPALELMVTYRLRGQKKQVLCTVPTVRCDSFWRLGIVLDEQLRLQLLLGDEKIHAASAPVELELR